MTHPASSSLNVFIDWGFRIIEAVLVLIMAAMVALVFLNVVLRYFFDTGIIFSEEISRMLFVWVSFVGAISVTRRGKHLSVNLFADRTSPSVQRLLRIAVDIAILGCCAMLGVGAWNQTVLNMHNFAPISGIPTGYVYAAALVSSVGIAFLIILDLFQAIACGEKPADQGGAS